MERGQPGLAPGVLGPLHPLRTPFPAGRGIHPTEPGEGRDWYGIDMQEGSEGELPAFPTPDELWNLTFTVPDAWRDRFAAVPFEDRGGYFQVRYYQVSGPASARSGPR